MSVVCMHMHGSRGACLTPRSRGRPGSGSFHSSVRCRVGRPSRNRHSCRWTSAPGAWCTRWREGGGGPGPRRRTRRSFSRNSETAGRSHNLFCWAPVGLAVLKPAQERRTTWVSASALGPPLTPRPTPLTLPQSQGSECPPCSHHQDRTSLIDFLFPSWLLSPRAVIPSNLFIKLLFWQSAHNIKATVSIMFCMTRWHQVLKLPGPPSKPNVFRTFSPLQTNTYIHAA